jgi:hypothetical protein
MKHVVNVTDMLIVLGGSLMPPEVIAARGDAPLGCKPGRFGGTPRGGVAPAP